MIVLSRIVNIFYQDGLVYALVNTINHGSGDKLQRDSCYLLSGGSQSGGMVRLKVWAIGLADSSGEIQIVTKLRFTILVNRDSESGCLVDSYPLYLSAIGGYF